MNVVDIFFLLVVGHVLADYPLQGDFLAKGKNRNSPFVGVPWYQAMFAHVMIHGGMVFMVTGSLFLSIMEILIHAIVDDAKCRGKIGYNTDQGIHIGCKVLWAILFVYVI